MAGTANSLPPGRAQVRASDAERDEAVARLRERFAAGQLSQDTFVGRMEAALGARDRQALAELFTDLPVPRRHWNSPWDRLAAAVSPVKDAVATSARRLAAAPWRGVRLPDLSFPPGSQFRFLIGRDPQCDLVIEDVTVSRQHALLDRCVRGWLLMDFGSTNGTRLNGWRVREPVPVSAGDQVTFGAVTFVLREGGSQAG
ncbi:MAG TPA: DUF1707 and FHA domain-containing protein [Streptosporangiaceae bacterium]|jgi:hypothetical protein